MGNIIIILPEKDVETLIHGLKIAIGYSPTGITSINSFRDLLDKVKKKTVKSINSETPKRIITYNNSPNLSPDEIEFNKTIAESLKKVGNQIEKVPTVIQGLEESKCQFCYKQEGTEVFYCNYTGAKDVYCKFTLEDCPLKPKQEPEYKIEALIEHDILENSRSVIVGMEEKQGYWLTFNDKRVLVFLDELWNKLCYWTHISPILSELEAEIEKLKERLNRLRKSHKNLFQIGQLNNFCREHNKKMKWSGTFWYCKEPVHTKSGNCGGGCN